MPSQAKRRSATIDGPVKRFRVSRACDQCRTERSKCDGNQPQCAPCFENKRTCTFTSNPRKRGLPPGYIRTIELALALVFQQNAEIEASLITKLSQPNTVLLARDTKESNRLHKNWRRTKFCRSLNKALTGGDHVEIEDENPLSSDEENGADAQETTLAEEVSNAVIASPVLQIPATSSIPERGFDMQRSKTYPELTPLPPNCWKLIETYTAYTQCWFPISEKLDILKLSYSYPSQGLTLSHAMPDAGHHAEMWSIFALGALQELVRRPNDQNTSTAIAPKKLYAVTQNLIPDELGKFQLGHVKAILNLAIFNISNSLYNAAWLLVGAASRILLSIEESPATLGSRRPHVFAGCFLLDNFLALVLDRRSYLSIQDLEKSGRIEEDGLEEWQPWSGELISGGLHQSQSPTLALSSFNTLVAVVDILGFATQQAAYSNLESTRRYETWKASMPPKLDYIRTETIKTPHTPPALLLQLTSVTTSFTLNPAPARLQQVFELMNIFREQLGFANLPCVTMCLLTCLKKSTMSMPTDLKSGIDRLLVDLSQAQSTSVAVSPIAIPQNIHDAFAKVSPGTLRSPQAVRGSPQSFQHQPTQQPPARHPSQTMSSSLLQDLLPDMNSNAHQGQALPPFDPSKVDTEFTSPGFDTYDPSISGDLDSFFDELASLHGAKKIQNQSQFMENLGFAPEISMADLLATQSGQFMPMNPAFSAEDGGPLQFPLNDYYDIEGG